MISLKNNYINNVITYNDISFNNNIIKNKDINNINKQYKQNQQLKQLTSAPIYPHIRLGLDFHYR